MARALPYSDSVDPNVLLNGDIIGFQVDGLGLLCTPSQYEPIPEREECVSHLRVCTTHKKPTNADYRRCMFVIENDSGERSTIVFGSAVKLSHYPTGLAIVASTIEDSGFKDAKLRCVFLSSNEQLPSDSLVHKWIVTPRYKLREEGDPVRHNDYIILRNAQYKQLCLTSFPKKVPLQQSGPVGSIASSFADHMVGLCTVALAHSKPGLNILLLRKVPHRHDSDSSPAAAAALGATGGKAGTAALPTRSVAENDDDGDGAVMSSDYIRVVHREYRGHLVVRTDDEVELQSSVMPLGATTRKRGDRCLDSTLCVFLRAFADQQPREQLDFPAAYSSQGVWQVLSTETSTEGAAVHGKVKFGTSVRLRHVITGQYLSVRPLTAEDTEKLKDYCSFSIPKLPTRAGQDFPGHQITPANKDRSKPTESAGEAGMSTALLDNAATSQRRESLKKDSNSGAAPAEAAAESVNICVDSVRAEDLHSTDWTGKHRNSVHLSMITAAGTWELRSKRSATGGNMCLWEFDKLNYDTHFSVTAADVHSNMLQAAVYRENVVSGRTLIGQGGVHVNPVVLSSDPDESMDMTIALVDPANGHPAGLLVVRLLVNPLLSKEEARVLAHKQAGGTGGGILKMLGGLAGVGGGGDNSNHTEEKPDAAGPVRMNTTDLDGEGADGSDSEGDGEEGRSKEGRIRELLEGGGGLSSLEVSATNWVVATSSVPDKYTKFNVLMVDKKTALDDDIVSYNERFVFEHAYTRQRLKLSTLLGMANQTTWWEYTGDVSLVPDPFREGSIQDSEVCQFERVDRDEIRDILYASRFLQLARAATTALQLTPRVNQLYMPIFRHFHNSLQSLILWTLGVVGSDSTLCAESTGPPEAKKLVKDSSAMKSLAAKLGTTSEKFLTAVGSDRLVAGVQHGVQQGVHGVQQGLHGVQQGLQGVQQGVQEGLALLGIDSEFITGSSHGGSDPDSDDDLFGSGVGEDYDDSDSDEERERDELDDADGGWSNAFGLQMNILSPGSKYKALESSGRRHSKKRKRQKEAEVQAVTPAEGPQTVRLSSLSPWIGRKVMRCDKKQKNKGGVLPDPFAPVEETALQRYSSARLDELVYKDLAVNEVLLRRQIILADMYVVDQIVHFLNVLFQLQRAAMLTHDERMHEQCPEVPPLVLACSVQINKLIRACVYKNDRVALKLISVQGSFLAMISQKIQGWEPPIDAILLQTCREQDSSAPTYGCVGSINSQNDSLIGSSMNSSASAKIHGTEEEEDDEAQGQETDAVGASFSIEPILMDAISASDIRQVVEQMHELHLKRDPAALKIIGLLTLLCSSGKAKKYFQNLLINALAIQDHEDYSLSGDFVQQLRSSSLQTNCMLFFTQFSQNRWEVKFNSPFSFPSQQGKNQEQLRHKLEREGSSLKKLFAYYNTDDNAVLDVMESFELLEDLGLGGPFLYKEIRYLESSTVWGFATWWCYRSGFYYPASSISQCQLSPIQAIQVMGEKMTPTLMELESRRTMISEQAVAMALDCVELLNSRIPGLCLAYEEVHERDADSLSIVEDYVRSLGDFGGSAKAEGKARGAEVSGSRGKSDWAARARTQAKHRPRPSAVNSAAGALPATEVRCEWVEFGAALDEANPESAWFRLSLNLLAEICKDRNAYTQRMVGSILPAECLLAALEADSVHYIEKSVLCKLMANVYVDHKLVFPTRFAPFNTDTIYLGYKEDVLNPPITMGKLFNAQSRTRFVGDGAEDGSELRRRLFIHLAGKIAGLQLVTRSRAKVTYFASLLCLFKLLLLKGFFQEPEFNFIESNKTSDDFVDGVRQHHVEVSASDSSLKTGSEVFNMGSVEKMMVEKLNFLVLAHECTSDFEEISALDDEIANEKHDVLHGKPAPKLSFSARTARRFRRKRRNEDEKEVNPEVAARRARARKTFDNIRDNFAFFDVLYADQAMAEVARSMIDILTYIHDIKQMQRLAHCWNYVVNAKLAMTERAYCMDMVNLDAFVPRLQMSEFLENLYEGFRCREPVPSYVQAVLSTTLYKDPELRRCAYELLDRQMSLVRDGQHMFEHLSLVSKGHKAFIYRLATVYEDQLLSYVYQVVGAPTPTNAYLLERMTFCIENLRALHFSTFLDRLDTAQTEEDARQKINRTITRMKREAKRLNIDAMSFQPDGKPEQDCMSYLQRPIPCPAGPDDFFELDLERTIMQEGELAALVAHFDVQHQTVDLAMPEAVVDCEVTMSRLGNELIRVMLQLTRAPVFFPWHALYDAEKFLIDQVLSFLAEVAYNSQKLVDEWYPLLVEFLISYFPESIGCGKMAISILRKCRAAHSGKDTFSRQVVRTIVHHGLVGTTLCSSILAAILQCEDVAAANFAASFMLSRIQDFTGTFNFRTPPSAMEGDEGLKHQLHSILHPLSLCFSGRMDIPDAIMSALRVPLSATFCNSYLKSEVVPLYLKTSICKIAQWMYPFEEVPVETLLVAEARNMRKLFSVESELDMERCTLFCKDFLFQGLLAVIKKRLLDSRAISMAEVNSEVTAIITDAEDHRCHNTGIARLVGAVLRDFFTKATQPVRERGKNASAALNADSDSEDDRTPAAADEHEKPGIFGDNVQDSMLDLSLFQGVMVLLNVLRLRGGHMNRLLHTAQRVDLIIVCVSCQLVMKRTPERVFNPLIGEGLRTADFQHMVDRLGQVVQGMVVEMLARAAEKHIASFYEAQLSEAARKQFSATVLSSVEKGVRGRSPIEMLQSCWSNDALGEERANFLGAMKLAVVFPTDYIVQTPYFLFLQDCLESAARFIDAGGELLFGDWKTPVVKSRSFASKFRSYSDFRLWLRGGGRYLQSALQHLSRTRHPTDSEYNLLHLLTALLRHTIEEIRQSSSLSLNVRLQLVERETNRLRRLQLTVNSLGAQSLLTIVLGNVHNCPEDSYVWLYAPLVLSFVNEIISWGNRESQDQLLDTVAFYIAKSKPPEMSCLLGLRTMIRRCNLEIAYCSTEETAENMRLKGGYPDSEHTKILRSVKQLFTFVGMFCKGDNLRAQLFFSAVGASSKQYVDLVLELCMLTNSVLSKFTSMIEYMRSTAFYERLAPLVWESKDASKRRYLAWHHPSNNILLFTQYMVTIVSMLDGLLSMCAEETAGSVQHALSKCPEVLEFAGLMQLEATSRLQTRVVAGVSTGKQVVRWSGGNPFHFYHTLTAHLTAAEMAEGDPENDMIIATLKKWSTLKPKSTSAAAFLLSAASLSMSDFLTVFGVSQELFEESARRMEEKCLSMVLAYFEVAAAHPSLDMACKFNDGLLMQNMNCTFQKIFSGGSAATDKYAPTAVAYTSLVETVGKHFPETQELLTAWEESCLVSGSDPRKVYGVVEILGKSGRLQRLYFPVPTFVSRFWPYPEVQKMKESIVIQVNRQSPEEKLADYLSQMQRITTVMKRQERLRSWLTYPVHAFFGGKTTSQSQFLPNQRMLALVLTLILNAYYCYFTSLGDPFEPNENSYLRHWVNWGFQDRMVVIVKAVHLGLNGSLTLSCILNSEVTDELFQTYRTDSAVLNALTAVAMSPLALSLLVYDTFWPLCMLSFSFLAFYTNSYWLYVPCLFDVAFQLTFMNFLYAAVAQNASKIWYTLVLAFLCLYFYSVIATLYFSGQYSLDNHAGCDNIIACFKLHLDYGLYNVPSWENDGYISPTLPFPFVYGTLVARAMGTVYNVSYVILINLVLQSIISGLIIDTFSKLREENEAVLQDIADKCFICSINRDEFEQAGIPFKQHIAEEHNMWHYVWFKIYLESKDPLTYSSSENYSAENLNDTQSFLKLMPIKKSISLKQKGELESDEKLEEKLDALLLAVSKLAHAQSKLGKSVSMLRRANARIEMRVNQKGEGSGQKVDAPANTPAFLR